MADQPGRQCRRWPAPSSGSSPRASRLGLALLILGAALALPGCKTVYQPLSRLHRPVAIDPAYANFPDLQLTLHCLPGPVLMEWDAEDQCRKLALLFENQGAQVRTSTSLARSPESEEEEAPDAVLQAAAGPPRPVQLSMVLTNRLLHEEKSWFVPWMTTDYTFAEDIVIRDGTGFLLVRDTLTGRLVRRFGFFGDADEQLSRDYYGQLSQLLFNAQMTHAVLGEARPEPGGGS